MVITIDTSVLLAVLLNEKHKSKIIKLTKGDELQAPASLDAEIGNALSAMFKRNRLTLNEAKQVVEQFKQIPIRRTKLRLREAVELTSIHNIYAYDAYVLDSAQQYRTPLISLDKELTKIGKKLGLNLIEVTQ
ncbi:MAG TPA: type II toxin-antitoxin system VapC family toxin [Balneolaceae bacterium]|nr:type II toxin-antitoxin system VapC family toxin [Balneolaceae bacterium]